MRRERKSNKEQIIVKETTIFTFHFCRVAGLYRREFKGAWKFFTAFLLLPLTTYRLPLSFAYRFLFLFLALLTAYRLPLSFGAFENFGVGARASSMGGAFSSVADDSNAVFFNPAGLAQIEKRTVSMTYARLFVGLENVQSWSGFVSLVHPLKSVRSALGVSWSNLTANGLYSEDAGIFSLSSHREIFGCDVFVGGNFKYLKIGYDLDPKTKSDPVFRNKEGDHAIGGDAGLLLKPGKVFRLAFFVRDINRPDMGFEKEIKTPITYRGGISYELLQWFKERRISTQVKSLAAAFDYSDRGDVQGYYGGMEIKFAKIPLSARAGTACEGGKIRDAASGLSYAIPFSDKNELQIDYAFNYPIQMENNMGTHRVTINFGF